MNTPILNFPLPAGAPPGTALLLFDGVCNFCNGSVQYILERDRREAFCFASLQSPLGQKITAAMGIPPQTMDTFVMLENGRAYTRSTAALRVLRRLGGWRALFYGLILFPRPLRDAVYSLIARNRYRWFGKRDSCMMPTPELRRRFLDA